MIATKSISTQVALDLYLEQLQLQDITPATLALRRAQLRAFHNWLEDREPTAQLGQIYLAELREKGYARNTLRGYYHALRPYFAYLEIPFQVRLRREKRLPRYHSHEDISRVLELIDQRKDNWARLKERDRLIFKTLASSGLRRAELLNLKCRDVKEGYLFVYHGKGDKDRVAPIPRKLSLELLDYIRESGFEPSDWLFPIGKVCLDVMVKGYARRAGIDDLTPHGLRHYFATRLLELGADIRRVQELLGHADISTTAIYLDVLPAHLRQTVELLEEE
jgi:site-specific recombinase XerD